MSNQISKNIFLFTGEDDFSIRQKIQIWKDEFAKKFSSSGLVTLSGEGISETDLSKKLEEQLAVSLFSSKKLIIAQNILPMKSSQETLIKALDKLIENLPQDYFLVFWQAKVDKRLSFIKDLVKKIQVVEFHLPHGRQLDDWIKRQAALHGAKIDQQAASKLAELVGRDLYEEKKASGQVVERHEAFDLWQVNFEIAKLAAFSNNITTENVTDLVVPKVSDNVFALSDELLKQDKKAALEVLERLISDQNQDEKSAAIKILGLISEQTRSLLLVNLLKNQNLNQNQIAESLGWSSGRVFVMLKHSGSASISKLKSLLGNLLQADIKLKSQDVSPKLLIDLLIVR